MRTFIVIPAYNQEVEVADVIKELKRASYENIVVVDDGSEDKTFENASKEGVEVLQHIVNRGQGASLRTGIDYSLNKGADVIVTFDSDGQHRTEDLPALLEPIIKKEVDVVLGSRFLKPNNVPLLRRLGLKSGAIFLNLTYGLKLTDSHNGLRALSRKAAEQIKIKSNKMEHASEILEQIKKKNLSYKEVPVTIFYTDQSLRKGQKTIKGGLTIIGRMILNKFLK